MRRAEEKVASGTLAHAFKGKRWAEGIELAKWVESPTTTTLKCKPQFELKTYQ